MVNGLAIKGLTPRAASLAHGGRRASISRKLTVAVAGAVLCAMIVTAALAAFQETLRHTESKLTYIHATASVFASATSPALAANDRAGAYTALRGVARAPGIVYARVERLDGTRLAEIGAGLQLDGDARLGGDGPVPLLRVLGSRTLEVTKPIVQSGETIGRITLVADNTDLMPRLRATLAQSILGAVAALLIAVVIAFRLKGAVVRPLIALTDAVRRIARTHTYDLQVAIDSDDEVGELCGGFNTMLDEIRVRERRISDLAFHDAETDLPNRHAFERVIGQRLETLADKPFAVAAIGVDRFQYVRGAIGYRLANDLLAEIGARALAAGEAARISTDVIGVLLDATDLATLRQRASALLMRVDEPILLGENTMEVGVSIGLAQAGIHASTPNGLIECASIALDQGQAARNKTHIFDEAAYSTTARNVSLMADMIRAISNGEMRIHLQPKYDLRVGAITGAEVLARWRHPERGVVPPDLFVGMAEDTGAISLLTEWSLHQTIACQRRLVAAGLPATLAVNLSGRLLDDPAFIGIAIQFVKRRAGDLYLEITETASIDNQARALENIEALLAAGAHISIDDYGSGLSSLAYLKRIPAHELKIDRAFIELLDRQPRDALLVKSTIDLAHSLGMKVTAEGVETEATLAALTAMGCDVVQGYLIARPMSEDAYIDFMGGTNARAASPAARG
ncbi:MAG: EAL domain-containing protein [Hyphomonadaceae bacterium]|nr:EAL domain-containing protein [Hyphomonadaceae bacterium]